MKSIITYLLSTAVTCLLALSNAYAGDMNVTLNINNGLDEKIILSNDSTVTSSDSVPKIVRAGNTANGDVILSDYETIKTVVYHSKDKGKCTYTIGPREVVTPLPDGRKVEKLHAGATGNQYSGVRCGFGIQGTAITINMQPK